MLIQYGPKTIRKNLKNFSEAETSKQPLVSGLSDDKCYCLLMIDPDAGKQKPNDPRPGNSDRYYLHWLIVNISGGDVSSGDTLVSYQGPTPPPGTGKHEYIFQLYEQPCGLTTGVTVKNRPNWSLQAFLKGKNLTLVESQSMFVGK
jgi:phosphatidylethanolamine-binding protein (PEBP) family uncharacterized protein